MIQKAIATFTIQMEFDFEIKDGEEFWEKYEYALNKLQRRLQRLKGANGLSIEHVEIQD